MSNTISGAKAFFKFSGSPDPVAYAQNCSYTMPYNMQDIEVMGLEHPKEISELGVGAIEFTCSMFRVYGKSAAALGMQPSLSAFLTQVENLTVEIFNKAATAEQPNSLLKVMGIKLISRSGTVDARGMWTETLTFRGLVAGDETLSPQSGTEGKIPVSA
jgi:hypothetical protein